MADVGETDIFFGCYWGDRLESTESCAARTIALARALARFDPAFAAWQLVVTAEGGAPLPDNPAELAGYIDAEAPGRGTSPITFTLVSWAQGKEEGAALSIACGGASGTPGILNSVLLRPVYEGFGLGPWMRRPRLILEAVVDSFQPDWGGLLTPEYRAAQAAPPRVPVVGAITYLDGWREEPPGGLPVERFHPGWMLDLLTGTGALPDRRAVLQLRDRLSHAGSLPPTPQVQPCG